jgi:hypothetical protein
MFCARGTLIAGCNNVQRCHLDFEGVDLQQLCALLEVVAAALCLAGPATAAPWGTVDILHCSILACLHQVMLGTGLLYGSQGR